MGNHLTYFHPSHGVHVGYARMKSLNLQKTLLPTSKWFTVGEREARISAHMDPILYVKTYH